MASTTVWSVVKCESETTPLSWAAASPKWTAPKPEQLEAQEIVTLLDPNCTRGPVAMEQIVGVDVGLSVGTVVFVQVEVAVSVGGTAVLVKV